MPLMDFVPIRVELVWWTWQGIEDSNTFRRTRLYNLPADLELRKWYYGLLKIFNAYADKTVGTVSMVLMVGRPVVAHV